VLWSLGFLVGGAALAIGIAIGGMTLAGMAGLDRHSIPVQAAMQSGAMLAAFGFFTWVIGHRQQGLTLADLRYRPAGGPAASIGLGFLAGCAPAAATLVLGVALGGARWTPDTGTAVEYLGSVGQTLAILVPAAFAEELIFRGVPMVVLARAFGREAAIVSLAVAFGLVHLLNPNVTGLGVVNVALAGIFLGAVFFTRGGIWAAFGAHLGWNTTLAALDAPVSGLPFRIPLIDYLSGGPAWLTGGSFGPEGGLLATITMLLATFAVVRWSRRAEGA
jgi:membrane protease YdiL (CAAX protease family)